MGCRSKIFIKPPVKKPFTCPYCREGLKTLEELEAHTKLHPAFRLGAWRMNNPVGGGLPGSGKRRGFARCGALGPVDTDLFRVICDRDLEGVVAK